MDLASDLHFTHAGLSCFKPTRSKCEWEFISGRARPAASSALIEIRNARPAIKKQTRIAAIEIHAHDDFGNAVENTMAAIKAASGVWDKVYASTTYLGIGERAGNAETEKVLLNLYLHYGIKKFEGKTQKLEQTADYIGKATGYVVPPNKAIVGDYGFAHESGIHTHGVLVDPWTYEPYPPELVGNERRLTIGKQSGKGIIKHKITVLAGDTPDDQTVATVVEKVKDIYANGRKALIERGRIQKNPPHTKNTPRKQPLNSSLIFCRKI